MCSARSLGVWGYARAKLSPVEVGDVIGLSLRPNEQGVSALLATMEDLKPADLADALHELPPVRRLEVATALTD